LYSGTNASENKRYAFIPGVVSYNLGALSLSTVHVPVITRTIKFVFRLRAAHAQIFTDIQFSHVFATIIKAVTVTGD